jgi:hypothetical protein
LINLTAEEKARVGEIKAMRESKEKQKASSTSTDRSDKHKPDVSSSASATNINSEVSPVMSQ